MKIREDQGKTKWKTNAIHSKPMRTNAKAMKVMYLLFYCSTFPLFYCSLLFIAFHWLSLLFIDFHCFSTCLAKHVDFLKFLLRFLATHIDIHWCSLIPIVFSQFWYKHVDFAEVLEKKNARVSLAQIIRELEGTQSTLYSPMVLNGSGFGLFANHSLVMASYISRANAATIDLRELLEKG